ncbi:RNA/RNP complex-1-interacting phosphatase [Aphelenchoides bicaudatus]|nr:RNA/RNP complex-1-interacting phosphatase [Aphelenchoides bicaudatus]
MVRTNRKLPKEWAKYEAIGNIVAKTRLFAFKTPLRHELVRRYLPEARFTVPDLYRELLFRNMPLGLVINATNTERYYDSREISDLSIEYQKLPASGRSFVECENLVKSFIKTVDEFLERNNDNNLLIGVHCTDGVNRAGYLICRYMIDRLGMSINDALNAFETSRGYNIERGALVQALYRAGKFRNNRTAASDEEENDLTERERRRKRRRQKEIADESFDPHTMQEIQSLVKTIKKMQSEPANGNHGSPKQEFTQFTMNSITSNNMSATSISFQNFQQQNRGTPQKQNISETSSPYVDESQDIEDEEENGDNSPIDLEKLGKIDVKELTTAQRRRLRRKNLKKQFDVMKKGRFWEIQQQQRN